MSNFTTQIEAKIDVVSYDGISKILLSIESAPNPRDEHTLIDILKSRSDLERNKMYRVTIEEI